MNQLSTEQSFIDSRDVAEMVEKQHFHLVRDIDNYVSVIKGNSQNPDLDSDKFFIENSYSSGTGKSYKNYHLTKKGCEVVANKMTGEKGILFTAEYVTRFNKMEQKELQPPTKEELLIRKMRVEVTLLNAKTQQAELLEGMVSKFGSRLSDASIQSLLSHSTYLLTGKELIPKHYTATEIGQEIGVNKNKIGRTANKHELKQEAYGMWVKFKSRYSDKQFEAFHYNELGKERLKGLLG